MNLPWSFSVPGVDGDDQEISFAELFHEATKINLGTLGQGEKSSFGPHDLFLMSRGFRQYRAIKTNILIDQTAHSSTFSDVLKRRRSRRTLSAAITFEELSSLLLQALEPTAIAVDETYGISQVLRANPSAGGLSSIDTYVICSKVDGVDPGTYHYNAITSSIDLISRDDPREKLRAGFFDQDYATNAAGAALFVAVLDRLAPKYGELRAYRLALLDAGHACQNLLLSAESIGISAVAVQGYHDDELANALGIDSVREIVVHSVLFGKSE